MTTKTEIAVNFSGLITLPRIPDGIDGIISVAENQKHIPFDIKRVYYIYNLNNPAAVRGKHAHKELEQVLFCISGSCTIGLDDGTHTQTIRLDQPHVGVYLGKGLWHTMQDFSRDCIMLVLASDVYNEKDYIRDYETFKQYIKDKIY
jgi:dTDP-4-dehydrorhamnose 3,5-epimerase-like enzyme